MKGGGKSAVRPDESTIKESAETIRAEVSRNGGRVKDLTGDIANDEFTRGMKERPDFDPTREIHPPYVPGTKVHDIESGGMQREYVRLVSPNEKGKLNRRGRWLMTREKFETIISQPNASDIFRELFALPNKPTHFSRVNLPEGEPLRIGIVNGHRKWGSGGEVQYEIISRLNKSWFEKPKEIPTLK